MQFVTAIQSVLLSANSCKFLCRDWLAYARSQLWSIILTHPRLTSDNKVSEAIFSESLATLVSMIVIGIGKARPCC